MFDGYAVFGGDSFKSALRRLGLFATCRVIESQEQVPAGMVYKERGGTVV